jgi:hypothetical protein
LFVTGPGPNAGGSNQGKPERVHILEKSGIGAVLSLACCANAADDSTHTTETVKMMDIRMIDFSSQDRAAQGLHRPQGVRE